MRNSLERPSLSDGLSLLYVLIETRDGHRVSKESSGLCGVRPAYAAGSRRVADPDPLVAYGRESAHHIFLQQYKSPSPRLH